MFANKLFEEKQNLVFAAIKQHFGSYVKANRIAEINNMELDDLIQIAQMVLWNLCLKYDQKREATFNNYVVRSIRWGISKELHVRGLPIKVGTDVSATDRNSLYFHSIDLHVKDEETKNEFFTVAPTNVEEEALLSVELNEVLSVLDEEEKFILIQKGYGFTDREIAQMLGRGKTKINLLKNAAIRKINPNYRAKRAV